MDSQSDLAAAILKLAESGKKPRRLADGSYSALCPCHDDRSPSLSVSIGDTKGVIFHCHAGCAKEDLARWFFGDAASSNGTGHREKRVASWGSLEALLQHVSPTKHYVYTDADGNDVAVALRYDPPHQRTRDGKKTFQKGHRRADGRWVLSALPKPRPLYRLPLIIAADLSEVVYVVEGEKCVEVMQEVGFIATTSEGGAENAAHSDWTPLTGRTVHILPDNDGPGEKYANDVAAILVEIGCDVSIVRIPELGPKEDVADFRQRFEAADFYEVLRSLPAEPWSRGRQPHATVPASPSREPYPLDALGPLEPYVRAVAISVSADPAAVATILIGTIAGAIGSTRTFAAHVGAFKQPAVLWCAVVSPSGDRKSAMLKRTVRPFMDASRQIVREAEDRLRQWNAEHPADERGKRHHEPGDEPPNVPLHWFSDATIEGVAANIKRNQRGLVRIDDELDSFFGGAGKYSASRGAAKAEMAAYRSMYDGAAIHTIRKGAEDILVDSAHCSIVGCVTPGGYRAGMTTEMREAGLAARFLVVAPDPVMGVFASPSVPPELVGAMESMFDRMLRRAGVAIEVRADDEAGEIISNWYAAVEARRYAAARSEPALAASLSKMTGTVLRLAGIVQEAWNGLSSSVPRVTIGPEAARAATRLADWYITEERLASQVGEDAIESQAEADLGSILIGAMRRDKERQIRAGEYVGITARELAKRCWRTQGLTTADEVEVLLPTLTQVPTLRREKTGKTCAWFL